MAGIGGTVAPPGMSGKSGMSGRSGISGMSGTPDGTAGGCAVGDVPPPDDVDPSLLAVGVGVAVAVAVGAFVGTGSSVGETAVSCGTSVAAGGGTAVSVANIKAGVGVGSSPPQPIVTNNKQARKNRSLFIIIITPFQTLRVLRKTLRV